MAKVEFTSGKLPPLVEFMQQIASEDAQYDPVEKLLSLERDLFVLEQKYKLSSAEFYQQYQAGVAGDSVEFVGWAGRYRLYRNLRQAISASLQLVISEQQPVLA
jgi:hypothetical protein